MAGAYVEPFDGVLTASSGPVGEAKTSILSNWFYYLGAGIGDSLDGNQRSAVAGAGLNFGVGPDGSVFVQGTTAQVGKQGAAATVTVSPVLVLLAVGAYLLWKRGS